MNSISTDSRILSPHYKKNDRWEEISFEEAFNIIVEKFQASESYMRALFAGGTATNEELYLLQRLARAGFKTNNIASFEYLLRGDKFCFDKNDIVPLSELSGASTFFCIGFDLQTENQQLYDIQQIIKNAPNIPAIYLDREPCGNIINYHAFFTAVNRQIIATQRTKGIFVQGVGKNYAAYRECVSQTDINNLLVDNNISMEQIDSFIELLLAQKNPVFIYKEEALCEKSIVELVNLALLIGIQAKPSSGLLGIKKQFNSQALFDMGIFADRAPGNSVFDLEIAIKMQKKYHAEIPYFKTNVRHLFEKEVLKNVFIFHEDPLSEEIYQKQKRCFDFDFLCVVTHSLTATAQRADLILPASLPAEIGGIYTDNTRQAHNIVKNAPNPLLLNSLEQISQLSELLGLSPLSHPTSIFLEYTDFFSGGCHSSQRHEFTITTNLLS